MLDVKESELAKRLTDPYQVSSLRDYSKISFFAMASPCEILVRGAGRATLKAIAQVATDEVSRIESKYSRYLKHNLCWRLNHSEGKPVKIDAETHGLLSYAAQLYQLSDGLFDITSGVLRELWEFKAGARPPSPAEVEAILPRIGFQKIEFDQHYCKVSAGMEIDFGGIGKEYAVDRVCEILEPITSTEKLDFLVNLGGDIRACHYSPTEQPWRIGAQPGVDVNAIAGVVNLVKGAVATSGSQLRCFEYQGENFCHILNPKTGIPIEGGPRSVTVFAASCSLAGSISSLAMLQGARAEEFLHSQNVKSHCVW